MFYDLKFSKKGVKCSNCYCEVAPKKPYFKFTDYDNPMLLANGRKIPNTKNVCLECSSVIMNKEFILYLKKVVNSLIVGMQILETVKGKEINEV